MLKNKAQIARFVNFTGLIFGIIYNLCQNDSQSFNVMLTIDALLTIWQNLKKNQNFFELLEIIFNFASRI